MTASDSIILDMKHGDIQYFEGSQEVDVSKEFQEKPDILEPKKYAKLDIFQYAKKSK